MRWRPGWRSPAKEGVQMDGARFDEFSKALAGNGTRRGFLKVLAGGVLAGLGLSLARSGEAEVARADSECCCKCKGVNGCQAASKYQDCVTFCGSAGVASCNADETCSNNVCAKKPAGNSAC